MRMILASVALAGLTACNIGQGSSPIPPDSLLAVSDGQETVAYGQVVSGAYAFDVAKPPVAFEVLDSKCRKPKARPGSKAAYVYTYGGGIRAPLHHLNFHDTPEQAEERRRMIREIKSGARQNAVASAATAFIAGNEAEWASRIDVVVTEREAPVFLYLSSYDPILWNIQLAPGAKLDGVVVNSYDAGAIANGTDAARTGLVSFANWPGSKCYAEAPMRAISVEKRIAAARKINPDFNPGPVRKQWEEDYRKGQRFDAEVAKLVGKRPDWIITHSPDGNGINAILVGKAPSAPIPVQPVTRLQIPAHITPFWGSRSDAIKAFGLEEAF